MTQTNNNKMLNDNKDAVVIRSYRHSTDEQVVLSIFKNGMLGLAPKTAAEMLSLYTSSQDATSYALLSSPLIVIYLLSSVLKIPLLISSGVILVAVYLLLKFLCHGTYKAYYGYVQMSLKEDLANIEEYYLKNGDKRHMWVATINEQVVGMVAVEQRKDHPHQAELRRMSVAANMQRRGIAGALIKTLEQHCKKQPEFTDIELETSSLQAAAIALYLRYGFKIVSRRKIYTLLPLEIIKFIKPIVSTVE